jgi:ATP/maltotriose-dependent transcriptional regulator MalT
MVLMVLDDYHLGGAGIGSLPAVFLNHLPPGLVISGRQRRLVAAHRLVAPVAGLHDRDLRQLMQESAEPLALQGAVLSPDAFAMLLQRSETGSRTLRLWSLSVGATRVERDIGAGATLNSYMTTLEG